MVCNTSVICAVSSQDEGRIELLQQHALNLAQQSVTVQPIYVFENRDSPPQDLPGEWVVSNASLTIYEAWNLALSMCRTPFVMNLNLDDRLHLDAVELLEQQIAAQSADMIGGEWKVCYTQEETNQVYRCSSAEDLPFLPDWPPIKHSATRLGSGTGQRGTYGPATLWRMSVHSTFPRYPYRTADGYRIRGIADCVWWHLLAADATKKLVQLPLIIGNYHSHPETQAEFRYENEWEIIGNDFVINRSIAPL